MERARSTGNMTVKQHERAAQCLARYAAGVADVELQPLLPTTWTQDELSIGFLLGLLVGEGHFGGDGRQPQITLRMHSRHERLFHWIMATFPGGRLYGPYNHGGRSYYQWMARGRFLTDELVPLIAAHLDLLDDHAAGRFAEMCTRYGLLAVPYPATNEG
jgi:hypothetical protein